MVYYFHFKLGFIMAFKQRLGNGMVMEVVEGEGLAGR